MTDSEPSETVDSKPSETTDLAPSETTDSASSETTDLVSAETVDLVPPETTDSEPSETVDLKPSETIDSKPSETTDSAPFETAVLMPSETVDFESFETVDFETFTTTVSEGFESVDFDPFDRVDSMPSESTVRETLSIPPPSVFQRGDQDPREAFCLLLRSDPQTYGIDSARWRLKDLSTVCEELAGYTESGIWRLLDRWGIAWKRGRDYLHSPDPDYLAKLAYNRSFLLRALEHPDRYGFFFQDELTTYRQPTLASAYETKGRNQPLARRSYASDTETRIAGLLDVLNGQVIYWQGTKFGIAQQIRLFRRLCEERRNQERFFVGIDNWPVHFHPDVLVALEEQECPWPYHRPKHWPTEPNEKARRQWGGLRLPIQLLPLPTYAPWTNPIEKLWRWLYQKVLHLHRLADALPTLRQQIRQFLDRFGKGSRDLLHYVGLSDPERLYASAIELLILTT